jgi:hypothetical protein
MFSTFTLLRVEQASPVDLQAMASEQSERKIELETIDSPAGRCTQ